MKTIAIGLSITTAAALAAVSFASAQTTRGGASQDQLIRRAESAAPRAVSRGATIAVAERGSLRTLREGTTGWTCLPSFPQPTGQATGQMSGKPICVDRNGSDWLEAWVEQKNPPANKIGSAYMLKGVSAHLINPRAKTGEDSAHWIDVGPHVMVLGLQTLKEGVSVSGQRGKSKIETSRPFIMWPGTPYEHLMIPLE